MTLSDFKKNPICFLLVAFCGLLPFQFALSPTQDVDLAIVRVLIPLLFLGWLAISFRKKDKLIESTPIVYLVFLYLFLAIFSVSFAQNPLWSLRKLLFLFSIAPIFFVATSVLKIPKKRCAIIFSLVCGAGVLAFFAIMQFVCQFIFGIDPVYDFLATKISPFFLGHSFAKTVQAYPSWLVNANGITYMRAIANFPDPHMLSYYFGMLVPWSIVLWASAKKHKTLLAALSLFLIFADIFTFTRGGYIALIAGGIVILPIVSKRTALKIILGISIFACLIAIVPSNPVGARFVSSFDTQEGSNKARLSNFEQARLIIFSHPFGVGIGNYSLAVDPNATYREPIYAHNLYLDTAAELGIPAMLVLSSLLVLVFKNFWSFAKKNSFYIAGVSSITIFSVHSLVENPFYSVHVFPLFLIIIALAAAIKHDEKICDN